MTTTETQTIDLDAPCMGRLIAITAEDVDGKSHRLEFLEPTEKAYPGEQIILRLNIGRRKEA